MIKNDLHYRNLKARLSDFEKVLIQIKNNQHEQIKSNPKLKDIYTHEIKRKIEDLRKAIAEYETLKNHPSDTPITIAIDDIDQLPQLLVKARIAAKLTHQELADLAGLTEDAIADFEEKDYETASFVEFMSVLYALDIKIQQGIFLIPLESLNKTAIALSLTAS